MMGKIYRLNVASIPLQNYLFYNFTTIDNKWLFKKTALFIVLDSHY